MTGARKIDRSDPEGWMKKLLMDIYEEAALKQIARQMSEGGTKVEAGEVVEVMVKLRKLQAAVDRKRFDEKQAMGELSGGGAVDSLASAPMGRHGKRLSTTDKLAMARLGDSGVENMAGAEDLGKVEKDETERGWLERIEGAQTLKEAEDLRAEMHGEYHEYNLKTTPGVSEHWENLNGKIEKLKASQAP